ncbi:heavy metal response regulator transcription factor [Chitinibacter sp. S2-10]|uniref:heavy metal response regulator transcription factor n=1 Tax=Chitinibacter sp. S2-10 TaxID=3373597 RepID=UPI00397790F1
MKILIIEDENQIASYIKKGLEEQGFSCLIAENGIDGLHCALEGDYSLIILDIMLPVLDGWAVLKAIRSKKETPVIILSARDRVDDRVRGFDNGADDYLIKPFAFPELYARINNILRRHQVINPSEVISIGGIEVDPIKHRAYVKGITIELSAKEFMLLLFFMRHSGKALTRSQIASHVWDINFDTDTNVIDVAVRRLRQKVELDPVTKYIHTVRGVGYIFELRNAD